MESFMLWSPAVEPGGLSLSFFATRIQVPCIGRGTLEMINQMLSDLGSPGIEYTDWSTRHFLNNYYSSPGEPISNPDAWSDTWEISLNLARPAPTDLTFLSDETEIRRTSAHDDTWDGTPPSSTAPYVIVARFYNQHLFARALTAFSEIHEPRGLKDPELQDLIDAIKEHPWSSDVSAWQRARAPMELAVALGTFDEVSFSTQGARLTEQVSELIHELGATITWHEKADYWIEQQRHSQ